MAASCSYNSDDEEEFLPQHDLESKPSMKPASIKKESEKSTLKAEGISPAQEKQKETKAKVEMSQGKKKLFSWLNSQMKIEMTDGRVLVGIFLCTDRDGNVILGSCTEYLNPQVCGFSDEPRILGLVMVPGRHIVSIQHDASISSSSSASASASAPIDTSHTQPALAQIVN